MSLNVKSRAFRDGQTIPEAYTCDGDDISPPLEWKNVPDETRSLALISDDPDAPVGTWVHWVIYNIPPDSEGLKENIPAVEKLDNGATQGRNDFGRTGYGGPCPPGGTHRYYFRLYALDVDTGFEPGLTKSELLKKIRGHIIDEAELMGQYSR